MPEAAQDVVCPICNEQRDADEMVPVTTVRDAVLDTLRKRHPEWSPGGSVCRACLDLARTEYVQDVLVAERGELSDLELDLMRKIQQQELVTEDTNAEFDSELTLGQRVADRVASFGGSWGFISLFGGVLVIWITVNSIALLQKPFDPFPFILLNLVLSCLAAIQAPVIMMSQNRQESRDRLRAEHDYKVNLKAELEIRQLGEKVDHLLTHQWERLAEIQQIQMDLMAELVTRKKAEG